VSEALVLPGLGQVVSLENVDECAIALESLRALEAQIREYKSYITEAIVEHSQAAGTKTLKLENGTQAEIRGGTETAYHADSLETELRMVGAPEDLINEIVITEITRKVDARRAKRAAAANPEYAAVIESNRYEIPKPHSVVIRKG